MSHLIKLSLCLLFLFSTHPADAAPVVADAAALRAAASSGEARVMVRFVVSGGTALDASRATPEVQARIAAARGQVLAGLEGLGSRVLRDYDLFPFLALAVSTKALAALEAMPEIDRIEPDRFAHLIDGRSKGPLPGAAPAAAEEGFSTPLLTESTDIIGASRAWSQGYTGAGRYVAVMDTGILRAHEFFSGKDVVETCFSANGDCPNGQTAMYGPGSAAPFPSSINGWDHGTHVAGIAAGRRPDGSMAGVARDANLLVAQVFSYVNGELGSYTSDQVKAMETLLQNLAYYPVDAVNMSLGGSTLYDSAAACDADNAIIKQAIDNLRAAGVAVVVASGNDSSCTGISAPACVSSAISVGSTDKNDVESSFNNWQDQLLDLLAPGENIVSSLPTSTVAYGPMDGTSMAAPHVAGAWSLLRQRWPTASVDEILARLRDTGRMIVTLCGTGAAKPRIQVNRALGEVTNMAPESLLLMGK